MAGDRKRLKVYSGEGDPGNLANWIEVPAGVSTSSIPDGWKEWVVPIACDDPGSIETERITGAWLAPEPDVAGPGISRWVSILAWVFVALVVILVGLALACVVLLLLAAADALVHSL